MTRITVILAAVLSFMAFTPLAAQDLQKGFDAYQAGDYATAIQEWTPLAKAGDALAQYNLGLLYNTGRGVPKDNVMAYMWYSVSEANGSIISAALTKDISQNMILKSIRKAQGMARDCMMSGYKKCGY